MISSFFPFSSDKVVFWQFSVVNVWNREYERTWEGASNRIVQQYLGACFSLLGPGQFENIAILGDKNRKEGPGMEKRAVENKRWGEMITSWFAQGCLYWNVCRQAIARPLGRSFHWVQMWTASLMLFYQTKVYKGSSVKAENYHYRKGLVKSSTTFETGIFM